MKQHANTISEFQVSAFGCAVSPTLLPNILPKTCDACSGDASTSGPGGNEKLEKDLKQSLIFLLPVLKKDVEITRN